MNVDTNNSNTNDCLSKPLPQTIAIMSQRYLAICLSWLGIWQRNFMMDYYEMIEAKEDCTKCTGYQDRGFYKLFTTMLTEINCASYFHHVSRSY